MHITHCLMNMYTTKSSNQVRLLPSELVWIDANLILATLSLFIWYFLKELIVSSHIINYSRLYRLKHCWDADWNERVANVVSGCRATANCVAVQRRWNFGPYSSSGERPRWLWWWNRIKKVSTWLVTNNFVLIFYAKVLRISICNTDLCFICCTGCTAENAASERQFYVLTLLLSLFCCWYFKLMQIPGEAMKSFFAFGAQFSLILPDKGNMPTT